MGGFSKNESSGRQRSDSSAQSFIAPQQVPFFNQLFQSAGGLAQQQAGQIGGAAQDLSSQLFGQGQGLLQQLAGLQAPGVGGQIGSLNSFNQNPLFQSLQAQLQGGGGPGSEVLQQLAAGGQLPGQQTLQGLAAGGGQGVDALLQENPALQSQIAGLDAAIQNNLRSTVGTIAGQGTLQGGTGGSRQALASGLAGQEAQRQFSQGATALSAQDFATRQALAPQIQQQQTQQQLQAAGLLQQGGLAGQGQQFGAARALQQGGQFNQAGISDLLAQQLQATGQAGQLGIQQGGLQGAASQAGLGSLSNLFNLGLSPFAAQFSPFLAASQIFGAPTVLSQSQQSSRGRTSGSGSGFSILPTG